MYLKLTKGNDNNKWAVCVNMDHVYQIRSRKEGEGSVLDFTFDNSEGKLETIAVFESPTQILAKLNGEVR